MTIGGDYTQDGQGRLHIDYSFATDGPSGAAGFGYDRLQVVGTATLGGVVSADVDVRPPAGERSVVVADLGITGTFDQGWASPPAGRRDRRPRTARDGRHRGRGPAERRARRAIPSCSTSRTS